MPTPTAAQQAKVRELEAAHGGELALEQPCPSRFHAAVLGTTRYLIGPRGGIRAMQTVRGCGDA